MPARSQQQFRAMAAAAHGRSTLGIPAGVGMGFVSATPNPGRLPKRARRRMGLRDAMAMQRKGMPR